MYISWLSIIFLSSFFLDSQLMYFLDSILINPFETFPSLTITINPFIGDPAPSITLITHSLPL